MTLEMIRDKVEHIREISGDDERAHSNEDSLREDFIKYVAESGNKKLSEMANEILKTNKIDFARWCAQ